jgi:hypothetical protein
MLAKNTTIVGVVLGMLFAARAHAQPDPDSETKPLDAAAAAAGGEGGEQLTLQKGRAVLNAYLGIGLSSGGAFKPVSISPDIWYGVTDDITAGVVHSAVGTTGFIGGVGESLCLTGSDNGCPDLYSNAGVEARYKLKMTGIALAVDGGLYSGHVSDLKLLEVKLGAVGRWQKGPLAVEAAPNLLIAVTDRSSTTTTNGISVTSGNSDVLNVPGTVLYTLNPMITLAGQSGLVLPLENTGDAYAVPLSIGAFYKVNDELNVSLAFSLPRLIAASGGGTDARSLTLGGSYAF